MNLARCQKATRFLLTTGYNNDKIKKLEVCYMDIKIKPMKKHFSAVLFCFLYFFIDIVFSEFALRFSTKGFSDGFPIFMILFATSTAFLLAGVCAAFAGKVRTVLIFIFSAVMYIIFAVQLVYHSFCGSYMQLAQIGMGGDVMNAFGDAMFLEILESAPGLLLLLMPIAALAIWGAVYYKKNGAAVWNKFERTPWQFIICEVAVFFLLHFGAVLCLPLGSRSFLSPYQTYHQTFKVERSVKYFGALTTLRLEVRNMFFGVDVKFNSGGEGKTQGNALDIDFASLAENEEDAELKDLHKYFATVDATDTNEFTGKFEGYNLILIAVESFTHHLIDKDLTPTLYKMANEGFIFNNYYNTVCDNTSNGEYALLTGLIPDTSLLGQGWTTFYNYNSFTTSKNNLLPFCLGNQFVANGGNAFAVHNHTASYYGRHKTHPNLGYEFLAFGQGLEVVDTYPTSDLSMMEQAMPIILEPEADGNIPQFHAYFLTFSGHMPYHFGQKDGKNYNDMAVKNKHLVEDLPYSDRVKAYIASQIELEAALDYMLKELEAAGELENTLIAITNDHYPYPLVTIQNEIHMKYLEELAGEKLDEHFDKYRSGLILWSASMDAPVEVDVPCCSLDVLPTLSNLLGLEFDSRLLAGRDVFSDAEHIAILADYSFITDKAIFNAETEEITLRDGVNELEDGYIERIQSVVQDRFTMSGKVLYNDYYRKIYE